MEINDFNPDPDRNLHHSHNLMDWSLARGKFHANLRDPHHNPDHPETLTDCSLALDRKTTNQPGQKHSLPGGSNESV